MAYGPVRFLYTNYLDSVTKVTADTQAVGRGQLMEKTSGSGAATGLCVVQYTGTVDRTVTIRIDSVTAGVSVGQATYQWRYNDSVGWEATGVTTSGTLTVLGLGISVAWVSHATEADFGLGDTFAFRVRANLGTQNLFDGNPNTTFESTAVDHLVFNLGSALPVTAFAMLNHNWVAGQTTCNLEANSSDAWGAPPYQEALTIADPLIFYPTGLTYQYLRLDPTDGALTENSIGELFIGTYLQLTNNAWWGTAQGQEYLGYAQESVWGLRRQQGLAPHRRYVLHYEHMSSADVASLITMQTALWNSTTGNVKPLFVHLISDDGGSTLILAHWVNWDAFSQQHFTPDLRKIPDLVFQELPVTSV